LELIAALRERFRQLLITIQDFTLFTWAAIRASATPPFHATETMHQLYFAGIGSLVIVVLTSVVAGQALALQLARELSN